MTFIASAEFKRPFVKIYLKEYGVEPSYINGDHRNETSKFEAQINNILNLYGFPLLDEITNDQQ